jgi:MarR family transcriptional regulator, lower aerobic nicotinate degradation pathway regulator
MQYQRDILDAIRRILKSLRESSRAAENQLGLSGAKLLVLQNLKDGKAKSINELADLTQTHQSSVSAVVSGLVESQLVKRQASPDDGRRVEIALSAQGTKLLNRKTPKLAQEALFAAIASLPKTKQKQLAELLSEVVSAAGFADQAPTLFFEDDREDAK